MKITWSWLQDWVELPRRPEELAHALAMRGFPVASIEKGVALDPSIVVGRVLDVAPHPNADRLRLCVVEIGGGTKLSVVCGAPNVAAGQSVAVAQIGAKLPDGTKLRKSKIRGVESEGMICSERELGLSEEAQGIWVLPGTPRVGSPVHELLGSGDAILDRRPLVGARRPGYGVGMSRRWIMALLISGAAGSCGVQSKVDVIPAPSNPATRTLEAHGISFQYPGNWDPGPGAWQREKNAFQYATGYGIDVQPLKWQDLAPGVTPNAALTNNAGLTYSGTSRAFREAIPTNTTIP